MAAANERLVLTMFLVVGILVHMTIGIGMRIAFGWRFGVVATIFAAKELGELKHGVAGSVTTLEKNIAMFAELFFNPAILPQWLLPAFAAWAIGIYLTRRKMPDLPE